MINNREEAYKGNRPCMAAERMHYVVPRDEKTHASDSMIAQGAYELVRLLPRYIMSHTPFLDFPKPEGRREDRNGDLEHVVTLTLMHLISDQDEALMDAYPTPEQRENLLDYMANKRARLRKIMANAKRKTKAGQEIKTYFGQCRASYSEIFMSVFPGIEKDRRFQDYVESLTEEDDELSRRKFQGAKKNRSSE